MEDPNTRQPLISVKTSDLVEKIKSHHENRDFYLSLLIGRMDNAFASHSPPHSWQQSVCTFTRKLPHSPILEEGKDDLTVKLLVMVATILESFEMILFLRQDCWKLLKGIYEFVKSFYRLKNFPILSDLYKEKNVETDPLVSTIFDAFLACFFQDKEKKYDQPMLHRSKYRKDIKHYLLRVNEAHKDLGTQMLVYILRCEERRLSKQRLRGGGKEGADQTEESLKRAKKEEEREFEQAKVEEINRERQVKEIKRLISLKSNKKQLAVVIQGDSGTSKTKLADAVYDVLEAELSFEGWKLHKFVLSKDVEFKPQIEELHSEIANMLEAGKKKKKHNGESMENEPVFIWIDNILGAQDLRKIFDIKEMGPQKVRLLVTSPNSYRNLTAALKECGFECAHYEIETFSANGGQDSEIMADPGSTSVDPLPLEIVKSYQKRFKETDEGGDKAAFEQAVLMWVDQENLIETGFRFAFENAYLNLPALARDAFLDVCSFFSTGWDWDEVSLIVGEAELQTLQANVWVKRNFDNQITVPEYLRSFARHRTKGIRVTTRDELETALKKENMITRIKGIWLLEENDRIEIAAGDLDHMSDSLRVLSLGSSAFVSGKCSGEFPKLRFLQAGRFLKEGGPAERLPFNVNKLPTLTYFSCDEDVDFDLSEVTPELKVARLCGDERFGFAPTTWKLKDLRMLELKMFQKLNKSQPQIFRPLDKLRELCIRTCSVVELPEGLSQLCVLQKLDLQDCKYLRKLPRSFGNLLYLEKLNLSSCSSLRHLPESFGQLQSLKELILTHCSALKQLPESFVCLDSLKKVKFSHCQNMQKLPDKFGQLDSLEELDFSYCKNLKMLANNFELFSSLQLLNLEGCGELEKLPATFPISLFKSKSVAIKMSGCSKLAELLGEFCHGNEIEDLSLASCTKLMKLPDQIHELNRLRKLNLSGCENLRSLPKSFSKLTCLEVLNLSSCHRLRDLCKSFHCLKALKDLNVSDCPRLPGKWMRIFKKIRSLRHVDIQGSDMLINRWKYSKRLHFPLKGKRRSHFIVIMDQDEHLNKQKILDRAASRFFKDNENLIGLDGTPFFPSNISSGMTLALFFDYNISHWDLEMLENDVDELLTNMDGMQVIYVGRSFTSIPTRLMERILAYTPENSKGLSYFDKPLFLTAAAEYWHFSTCIIKTKVTQGDKGHKQFTEWESMSANLVGRKLKIKGYGNIEKTIAIESPLITSENKELIMTKANSTGEVKISELKGKMIFLLISTLEITKKQINFLQIMYEEMQKTHNEPQVAWVWFPVTNADEKLWSQTYEQLAQMMPWLTINPWSMDQATLRKILTEKMGFCKMPILVSLDHKGLTPPTDVMRMVATMGSKAWLFVNNPNKGTHEENGMQNQSNLEFLLTGFLGTRMQRSESQITWLYGGDPEKASDFNTQLKHVDVLKTRIIYVGRRRFLQDIYSIEEEKELHEKNTGDLSWLSLSFEEVKKFWHYIHYLVYLIAHLIANEQEERDKKSEENKKKLRKLQSLRRLLLGLWSLDCISKRNSSMWMMAIDKTGNEILTGRGREIVERLSPNNEESIDLSELESGIIKVHPKKTEEGKDSKNAVRTIEDGIWLTAHPSSHLMEQISDNNFCSFCLQDSAYHCDICDCFGVCRKCYISEFIMKRKDRRGEQIYIESMQ